MISQDYINRLRTLTPLDVTVSVMWNDIIGCYPHAGKHEYMLLARTCISQVSINLREPFDHIIIGMEDLHRRKNAGYVGSSLDPWANFRKCTKFGISVSDGIITRMCDKYSRYTALTENPAHDMVNESINDTLIDLAAYAIILTCIMDEKPATQYIRLQLFYDQTFDNEE